MNQFRRILGTDLRNLFTNPMWLFYNIGFALAMVLVLGFLTSGGYGDAVTSYDYYGVTLMVFAALNSATIAANSFMEERIKNGNMRILYAPVPAFAIPLSKILASAVFGLVCHLFDALVLHFLVGVQYGSDLATMGGILLVTVCAEFFFAALGVLLCCGLKSESAANQLLSLVLALLSVLGGLFFPIEGYGKILYVASNLSPVKWLATSAFRMIYDGNFALLAPVCLLLTALTAEAIALSAKLFHGEDYLL